MNAVVTRTNERAASPSGATRYDMKTDNIFKAGFKTREGETKSEFTTSGITSVTSRSGVFESLKGREWDCFSSLREVAFKNTLRNEDGVCSFTYAYFAN